MTDEKQLWIDEIVGEINAYQIKVDKAEHDITRWKDQIYQRERLIQRIIDNGLPEKRKECLI